MSKKILFIQPGTSITGAPIIMVNLIKWLKENSDLELSVLLTGRGPLKKKIENLCEIYTWDGYISTQWYENYYFIRVIKRVLKKILVIKEPSYQDKIINILKKGNFDLVYANSVVSSSIILILKKHLKCKVILHLHELEISIAEYCGVETFKKAILCIDYFICVSEAVRSNLKLRYSVRTDDIRLIYEFIPRRDLGNLLPEIRNDLGIPQDGFIVTGSGTLDWRKGSDIFVQIAKKVSSKNEAIYFIWVGGNKDEIAYKKLMYDIENLNLKVRVFFIGPVDDPFIFFRNSDIFMLTSREDPYPLVCLEAALAEKPILCFDNAGGMPEFVEDDCGFVVPYLDLDSMAERIIELERDRNLLHILGVNAARKVKRHDINIACKEIETVIQTVIES